MKGFSKFFTQNQVNRQNPKQMAINMIENLKASGKITEDQYNSMMQNPNDPNAIINVMMQKGLVNNEQYSKASNQVNSFFGSK